MRRLLAVLKATPPVLLIGIVVASAGVAAALWLNGATSAPSCPAPATVEPQVGQSE